MENTQDQRAELIGKTWPVLDQGHVQLVDVMGDDQAVIVAARVSFGTGTRRVSENRDLIRYLMRHHHMTPFEMAEIKIRVRVPMDTWRQWIRHRTANVNEYSTRYSEAIDAAQRTAPGKWRQQATNNKQGSSGEFVTEWPADYQGFTGFTGSATEFGPSWTPGDHLSAEEVDLQEFAQNVYKERLRFGVAREQARKDLPLSTYTDAYWKCDLRNVLHFLGLRMDEHAQWEIRQYANIIGEQIVAPLFPLTWNAFVDYHLNAITLSETDQSVIKLLRVNGDVQALASVANRREREECRAKLVRLGLIEQ